MKNLMNLLPLFPEGTIFRKPRHHDFPPRAGANWSLIVELQYVVLPLWHNARKAFFNPTHPKEEGEKKLAFDIFCFLNL